MSTLSQFAGGGIKSIQRGTISISAGAGTGSNTATITSVDTTKSELRLLGWTGGGAGIIGQARLSLTNATTITANVDGNAGTYVVSYEITERY